MTTWLLEHGLHVFLSQKRMIALYKLQKNEILFFSALQ